MTEKQDLEQWTYWMVFYTDDGEIMEVYHALGLMEKPTAEETVGFINELRTDEEFGLGDKVDELKIKVVPKFIGLRIVEEIMKG